ncbi:MAG: OmpA family protein [Oligoflexia bacterium]|nr:OmpA family protein [Oligoflexia bacterium]
MLKRTALLLPLVFCAGVASAQDLLPADNGISSYHSSPRYRESESHPLRIAAYVLHPIGWLAREVVFRPFSYFVSSTETTRSIFGYREPFDYRQPDCFSADDSTPDCRTLMPFNYDSPSTDGHGTAAAVEPASDTASVGAAADRQVYFPDVNFDFDRHALNDLGRGRAHQLASLLSKEPGLKVVLQGHADYKGSDSYNQKLGMDRAEALRQELVALGVQADRLSTVSFGESKPVLGDQENWARAVNRRVEVHSGDAAAQ